MNRDYSKVNNTGKFNLDAPIGALKTQVSKLLLSVDRIGWSTGETSGRFDVRRVGRMLAGSERVFKTRTESEAVTTAVSIIIDLSSSMYGKRAEAAAQTAYALCDAIERVGCEVQVVGFSNAGVSRAPRVDRMRDSAGERAPKLTTGLGSYHQGTMILIKGFNHKLHERKVVFQYMWSLIGGCTPDYHIVRTAVEQLALHPAKRKIAIVLTDGFGNIPQMKAMGDVSEKLWGIPILGIGIMTPDYAMQCAYKYYAGIKNVSDLATGALRLLVNKLKDGEKKAA